MRTTSSREVQRNAWMSVREDEVVLPDGQPGLYGVVDKPDFALAVPHEGDGSLWLVEQYRYPVQRRSWEFPQGSWPASASAGSPVELARAELREETGLSAAGLEHLGRLHVAPGFCGQPFDVWLATGLVAGPPEREVTEQGMRTRRVADVEFRRMSATASWSTQPASRRTSCASCSPDAPCAVPARILARRHDRAARARPQLPGRHVGLGLVRLPALPGRARPRGRLDRPRFRGHSV